MNDLCLYLLSHLCDNIHKWINIKKVLMNRIREDSVHKIC